MTRISLIVLSLLSPSFATETVSEAEKLFALKVKPLFAAKCLACHGDEPDKPKGGFDMRTRTSMLKGGKNFGQEVIKPANGDTSYLYITTARKEEGYEMPPKEADKLTKEEQGWIRAWINADAPWPNEARIAAIQETYAEGIKVATSKALSEDWQQRRYNPQSLWAYHPLDVWKVPEGSHPVDWFIDQRLKEVSLASAPPANGQELARRISFGMTGLPPSPEAVEEFVAFYATDKAAAVATYAQELMATPQYGEHFARHWLDVTRYADSGGFANDYARPNAWRYRDYVIRAFNQDKPYDAFVREQIAGDELDASEPEHLIATGFLRMGPWEQTSMSVFKETRQLWLDDVTDSVGQTFLGHTLQCAKCHDHKFDPVPSRDYYRMMAVFSTTQFAGRDAAFVDQENQNSFSISDAWVKAKMKAYQNQQTALEDKVKRARKQESGAAKVGNNGLDPGDEASLARINKNIMRHRLELERTLPIAFAVYTGTTITRKNINSRLKMPAKPWGKGVLESDAILTGGNIYSPSDPVTPGALTAVESLGNMTTKAFPKGKGNRRLALAEWITNEKNPLTARVMVNRLWSWHFGQGLAGNPSNFGSTGERPTHPALLDYLAQWFMDQGWSVKKLNALIVSSKAYQRSSRHPQLTEQRSKDPKQHLYATFQPRRLSAEELRDAMLASSGEMNPQVGGIPARPDMNEEVAFQPRQIMGGTASVYEPDPLPAQRNRRSIYAEKLRGLRDPFLESFNQPGPDDSCERRETSTVAPQALTLLNAAEVHDRALALADRLMKERITAADKVQRAFALTLGRTASNQEQKACLDHWRIATGEETDRTHERKSYVNHVNRTVMAEKTGEPYDFVELMPAYDNYQPDLQPSDVDAPTRGLAQVCLVLFNSNEFAYLD